VSWRIPITCEHGGDAGILRDGSPRCPMCRRARELAESKPARDASHHRTSRPGYVYVHGLGHVPADEAHTAPAWSPTASLSDDSPTTEGNDR
jgi:hypothetical protein